MLIGMAFLRAWAVVAMIVAFTLLAAKTMETVIKVLVACSGGQVDNLDCQCPWVWLASICTIVRKQGQFARPATMVRRPQV